MIATHCIFHGGKCFPRLVRSSPAQWLSQLVVSGHGCLCCTPLLRHCKSTLETDTGCDGPSSWSFILGAPKLFQWRNNVLWKPDSREFQFPLASPQTSFHVYRNITSSIMLGKQKSFIHRMKVLSLKQEADDALSSLQTFLRIKEKLWKTAWSCYI